MTRCLFLLATLALAACSHGRLAPLTVEGKPVHGSLAYAPADTPYFISMVEPIPEALSLRLLAMGAQSLRAQLKVMDQSIETLEKETKPEAGNHVGTARQAMVAKKKNELRQARLAKKVLGKLARMYADGELEKYGLSLDVQGCIYGLGTTPVARFKLANVEVFDGHLLDALSQAQVTWEARKVGTRVVRTITLADDPTAPVIVQLYDRGDLVVSVAGQGDVEALTPWLVGDKRPAKALSTSARLKTLLKGIPEGRLRYAVGGFNLLRLIEAMAWTKHPHPDFVAKQVQASESFMKQGRDEVRLIASMFGESSLISDLNPSGVFHTHLTQDMAPALLSSMKLGASIPGPETTEGMLFDFGLGVNLKELAALASQAIPAHIAEQAAQGRPTTKPKKRLMGRYEDGSPRYETTQVPMLPMPKAGWIPPLVLKQRGLRLSLMSMDFKGDSTLALLGSLKVILVIASDDPAELLSLAQRIPKAGALVKGLELPETGEPVSMDQRLPLPGVSIARSKRAIGLSFGTGMAQMMKQWLNAPEAAQAPISTTTIDVAFVVEAAQYALRMMKQRAASKPKKDKGAELIDALTTVIQSLENQGRSEMVIRHTERGLAMDITQDVQDQLAQQKTDD